MPANIELKARIIDLPTVAAAAAALSDSPISLPTRVT
jgi:hypothetical protein